VRRRERLLLLQRQRGRALPLRALVLAFEVLAPLWFALRWTRAPALVCTLAMHVGIALMFGAVAWFAILMIAVTPYLPERLLFLPGDLPGR